MNNIRSESFGFRGQGFAYKHLCAAFLGNVAVAPIPRPTNPTTHNPNEPYDAR